MFQTITFRSLQFQDIGELWRYKNETLHAFIRGAEQQRRNCYLDTAVMRGTAWSNILKKMWNVLFLPLECIL